MISETFCILPWIHVSVGIVGNHRLCCYQSQDKKDADSGDLKIKGNLKIDKIPLEDIWNSEMYREVRKRMIRGEPIGVCSKCYREERSGVTSYRNLANRQFSSNIPEINSDGMCSLDSIRYLDIKFGNKCNLKCRMCYAPVSSSLIAEEKRYGV
ncbi:MAG: SPASM domain-containing protein, partial [Candidatus Heimdallarchaeaceae archaeon]